MHGEFEATCLAGAFSRVYHISKYPQFIGVDHWLCVLLIRTWHRSVSKHGKWFGCATNRLQMQSTVCVLFTMNTSSESLYGCRFCGICVERRTLAPFSTGMLENGPLWIVVWFSRCVTEQLLGFLYSSRVGPLLTCNIDVENII